MKFRLLKNVVAAGVFLTSVSALALDADGQSLMRMLKEDTTHSIRQAAQIIVQQKYKDPEVLDFAYGILQKKYANSTDRQMSDALAWLCKALAVSRDNKYLPVIEEAARSGNPALEKHCGRAATDLGSRQKQTSSRSRRERARDVETARVPETPSKSAPSAPVATAAALAAVAASPVRSSGAQRSAAPVPVQPRPAAAYTPASGSLAGVTTGMSQAQVERLLGPATSFTYSLVGKNVEESDPAAVAGYGLYPGRGIVVYTVDPATLNYAVMRSVANGSESGYP